MQLELKPMAGLPGQTETEITVSADTITVDGVAYDLSAVPEGGEATPEGDHPFVGTITRAGGEISCAIRCAYDASISEPNQPDDPAHWIFTATSGAISIPVIRKETQA